MAEDLGKESRWLGMYVTGDIGPLTFYTNQRAKMVAFPRAPPLCPPTHTQEVFRDLFRAQAKSWRGLSPEQQNQWLTVARKCNLAISGYNLWTWYYRHRRTDELATLERQAGITLTKP